jgi:hypothetical protein
MRRFSNPLRAAALAVLLTALAGCSQYFDHRDTISLGGGNAVASDKVSQMVDPWPAASAQRNIAYNGDRMESAFARYRTGKVIQPRGLGTSDSYQQPQGSDQNNAAPVGPAVAAPAAAVK